MSKIKSKNTRPELMVRKALWNSGYRYRLHTSALPGKPDVYIPRNSIAVFVHGCFWHQHRGCKRNFMPKSNIKYWEKKLNNNVVRFKKNSKLLEEKVISIIVIWECETKDAKPLEKIIQERIPKQNLKV